MQESIFEAGWVNKQTGIFKRQSKAWMILSSEGLFTYNNQTDGTQINKLDLSEIKSIEKKCKSSFVVHTSAKSHLFTTEEDAERWVSAIYKLLNPPLQSSEQFLVAMISRLKQALQARESELLLENERSLSLQRSVGRSQLSSLAVAESELVKASKSMNEAVSDSLINRIKHIKNTISAQPIKTEPFDMFTNDFKGETMQFQELLRNCISVTCTNPNDLIARRSSITRALKWRYTGDKVDALSFTVNCDVLLSSVGICTPCKQGTRLQIKKFLVLKGKTTDCKPVYIHKECTTVNHQPGKPVVQIPLNSSIVLNKNQQYTVYFLIEGGPSFKCVDCLALSTIGGTEWTFFDTEFTVGHFSNRTDSVCGPIANFQFQKLTNS